MFEWFNLEAQEPKKEGAYLCRVCKFSSARTANNRIIAFPESYEYKVVNYVNHDWDDNALDIEDVVLAWTDFPKCDMVASVNVFDLEEE